jgi:ABC-2 type transport system ATP-binding protein
VIVVDEPMVGLDPKAARVLKDLFRAYVELGNTIVMSTHTLEVAETLCDRVAIVQTGRIVALGTMQELQTTTESNSSLEQIFLRLTGETAARSAAAVLSR